MKYEQVQNLKLRFDNMDQYNNDPFGIPWDELITAEDVKFLLDIALNSDYHYFSDLQKD